MMHIIRVHGTEELELAKSMLIGMGYQLVADSFWNQTYSKDGGQILIQVG